MKMEYNMTGMDVYIATHSPPPPLPPPFGSRVQINNLLFLNFINFDYQFMVSHF